jgi:Domain of unknown function (DUF3291)
MADFTQPAGHHLAQINVSTALWPMDDPRMAGFVGATAAVNQIAERSEGFIWRLKDKNGAYALALTVDDHPGMLINISVWSSVEALEQFVWKTVHAKVYNRKAEWFPHEREATLALWWQPVGVIPTQTEGFDRLQHLRTHGPGETAFGWSQLRGAEMWRESRCG